MRIDGKLRRSLKASARSNLRRHYFIFVMMCLFASLIGSEFVLSDNFITTRNDPVDYVVNDYGEEIIEAEQKAAAFTGTSTFSEMMSRVVDDIKITDAKANEVFSRSSGTINHVIDFFTGGTMVSTISSVVFNIVGSQNAADIVMIALSSVFTVGFWMFVQNVYISIIRRVALEGRIYKRVPAARFLFFVRNRSWFNAALVMAIWSLADLISVATIIGFPIVFYGLFMVPYILAENPQIKPLQAIKLSWRMTKGHKLDLFMISLSYIGWDILGVLTFGLTNVLFTNPYKVSVYSEVYAQLRKEYIDGNMPDSILLSDRFLFEKCDLNRLKASYHDVINVLGSPEYKLKDLTGAKDFFASHFGVVLWNTKDELKYEENQASRQRIINLKDEAEGISYPVRLAPIPESRKIRSFANLHYMRHYSILSLVLMFFIYSGFGWVWEVFYYYMLQGHYINRGVLHGPWLPIYGAGGLAILIFLFPLRKSPSKHFVVTMILCGAMEYLTSVILEYVFGAKWWSYEGFFLNLNGRICAEGLLVFGVAGLAFIYFLSPLLDNLIRKINPMKLMPLAIILVTLFVFDFVYSNLHPNMGDGITDGFAGNENSIVTMTVESN